MLDPAGNNNGRLDAGETVDLVAWLKNFGTSVTGLTADLHTTDPFVTILDGSASYGTLLAGATGDNSADPFALVAAPYAPEGHVVPLRLVLTYTGGEQIVEFGLTIGRRTFIVWDPAPDHSGGPALYDALRALGHLGGLTDVLPAAGDLQGYRCLFISLGIYNNNYIISAGGQEAQAITAFLQQGGCVYMEGGDCWYYDPTIGGHNFGPLFGLTGATDGSSDLNRVLGAAGTWTQGMNFGYAGENSYIDHLVPSAAGAFTLLTNSAPAYTCGVAYETSTYRTVGCSFEFGGLVDGASPSTRLELAAAIMGFFQPVDPQGLTPTPDAVSFLAPAQPNPCLTHTLVRYGLADSGPVQIGLYDVGGRCVRALVSGTRSAGVHALEIDARELDAGIYFLRSSFDGRDEARKLVVTR